MTNVKDRNSEVLTIPEMAEYLGLSEITIEKYARAGKLPGFKVGPSWRFRMKTIDKWMEEQEKNHPKLKVSSTIAVVALLTLIVFPNDAYAVGSSGWENAVLSTRSLSRGNAVTANAEDASTIAFNPAGLTKIGDESYIGSSQILANFKYTARDGTVDDGSQTVIPVPYAYVSMNTPIENLSLGIGANSPFGLLNHNSSTGSFVYSAYWNEIKTEAYHLSAGYKLNEKLSIGGGWTLQEFKLKQVGKFNRALVAGTTQDAPFEYDVSGQGQGWNLGLMYDVSEDDTLGFFFRSEVRTHLKGTMSTHELQGGLATVFASGDSNITSADTDITTPASVNLGWSHRFSDKFDYEVDVTWTGWGSYDSLDTVYGTSNAVLVGFEHLNRDFKDTWAIHTGGSYDVNENMTLNIGYYWQDMAQNRLNYSNITADGDRHGLGLGLERVINEKWTLDFNYLGILFTEQEINNQAAVANLSTVDGNYKGFLHVVSVGLRFDY